MQNMDDIIKCHENNALNLDAVNLPKAKQTNALNMAVANDALNLDALNLPETKRTNVLHTVVANDVQIASLGQILAVGQSHMMDIVQRVLSNCSPLMNEVRSFTPTQRKSGCAMQSMMPLKDSFTTNHYTQETVTALIGDALTIAN